MESPPAVQTPPLPSLSTLTGGSQPGRAYGGMLEGGVAECVRSIAVERTTRKMRVVATLLKINSSYYACIAMLCLLGRHAPEFLSGAWRCCSRLALQVLAHLLTSYLKNVGSIRMFKRVAV